MNISVKYNDNYDLINVYTRFNTYVSAYNAYTDEYELRPLAQCVLGASSEYNVVQA